MGKRSAESDVLEQWAERFTASKVKHVTSGNGKILRVTSLKLRRVRGWWFEV